MQIFLTEFQIIYWDTPSYRRSLMPSNPALECGLHRSDWLPKTRAREGRKVTLQKRILTNTKLGWCSRSTSRAMNHADRVCTWQDVMRRAPHFCALPPNPVEPWERIHHTNSNWGTVCKIPGQHALQLSRSWKTRRGWEVSKYQRRFRRHDK